MKIKVALIDDHELYREGIRSLLEKIADTKITGLYENYRQFSESLITETPDIILIDYDILKFDFYNTINSIQLKIPDTKIIILSKHIECDNYQAMLNIGIKGIIQKEITRTELEKAIKEVHEGNLHFSSEFLNKIINNITTGTKKQNTQIMLTSKEIQLIEMVCNGLSNREISEKLYVSSKTVENYKTKIFDKVGAKSSIELVVYAIKNKIVEI